METEPANPQVDRSAVTSGVVVTWPMFRRNCQRIKERINKRLIANPARPFPGIYGVPTGGCFVAQEVSRLFGALPLDEPAEGCIVLDDVVDSGKTLERYPDALQRDAMYRKPTSPANLAPEAATARGWIKFPWEHSSTPEDAVVRLLEYIGEDPTRDGLAKTPSRVCRALAEMTEGYKQDPVEVLGTRFESTWDEMVVLRGIRFSSLCEHHILPFTGTVDIAYIPSVAGVVGISKLARLVRVFSRRLQIQERMTEEIARAIMDNLKAEGVAVVVRAHHHCMGCRGVRQPDAAMVTSSMLGCMRHSGPARAEFFALAEA